MVALVARRTNQEKKKQKSRKDVVCPHYGTKGHSTKRSKYCTANPKNVAPSAPISTQPATQEELLASIDAADADQMDSFPLQDDLSSDDDNFLNAKLGESQVAMIVKQIRP